MNKVGYRAFTFLLLLVLGHTALGQVNTSISARYSEQPLSEVLSDLQSRYDLVFAFDPELLSEIRVTVSIQDLKLEQALDHLLAGTPLDYEVLDFRKVVIFQDVRKKAPTLRYTLSGRIMDGKEGEPLPYAHISLVDHRKGLYSDEQGRFIVKNLPPGRTLVRVSYAGFLPWEAEIRPEQVMQDLEIKLLPSERQLDEVLIANGAAQSMQVADAPGKVQINPQRISTLSGLGEPDIFRAIQLLPGVGGTNVASSGLYIRGGTPDQNLVRFDGITAFRVDHFFGLFSSFNTQAVQNVEVHRGGFGAEYGGRVSGVVDITGKSGRIDRPAAWAGVNLLNAHFGLEVPLPNQKGSFMIASRRSYSDLIRSPFYKRLFDHIATPPQNGRKPWDLFREADRSTLKLYDLNRKFEFHPLENASSVGGASPLEDDIYNLNAHLTYRSANRDLLRQEATPSFYFNDLNAKLTYLPSDKDVVTATFFQGADHLSYEYDDWPLIGMQIRTVDRLHLENFGTSATWMRQWNNRLYSKTQGAFSNYGSRYEYGFQGADDSTDFSTFIDQSNRIQEFAFRHQTQWVIDASNVLEGGVEVTRQQVSYRLASDTIGLSRFKPGTTYASFLQHEVSSGDNVKLVLGMRGTYFDRTKKWYVEPRVSFHARLSDQMRFKIAWGTYQQYVNRIRFNNGLGLGEDFWAIADGDQIPVQNAMHLIAGLAYETPHFLVDVEAYYKTTSGLLTYSFGSVPLEIKEGGSSNLLSDGVAVVGGLDVMVQKKIGLYTGWLSYSLNHVNQRFESIERGSPFPALQDQRHEAKLVNAFTLGKWDLATTSFFASGRPYTKAINTEVKLQSDGTESVGLEAGDRNSQRLPAYHRMDLAVTYNFLWGNTKGKVGFSIYNLFNQRNVRARRYFLDDPLSSGEEPSITTVDVLDLGLSPNLFFEVRF